MKELFTEVSKDLQIIEDLFCESDKDYNTLFRQLDISEEDFLAIKTERLTPDKIQLENIYNFAYNHNLYLNEISWQDTLDEFSSENIVVLSHGARTNINDNISLNKSGSSNDFADGFYLGQSLDQAGMWVANDVNSSLYVFTFDKSNLKEARFNVSVEWMLAISYFRNKLIQYDNSPLIIAIKDKVENCDYVYAPIADNNLFEVIDAFSNGEITDLQCLYALSATHLGYQYVIKDTNALNNLNMNKHLYLCSVEKSLYNKESDIESNTAMQKALIAKNKYKDSGKYIHELLGESKLEESAVQGFEYYSKDELLDDIHWYVQDIIDDFELPIKIVDIDIYGSRNRNTASENSDLDVVVEYDGDFREDSLFSILNEEPLIINGIEVDINPIHKDKTGDIKSFIKTSKEYDKEILNDIS